MEEGKSKLHISKATMSRLPIYLYYLQGKDNTGIDYISSSLIAEDLKQNAVQVRKDLALVSSHPGKPKLGFNIHELVQDIEDFLGYGNTNEAIIVGAGGLGKTLMSYTGFDAYGLKIVAAFDVNQSLIGTEVNGKPIFDYERLENLIDRMKINIGIITVPKQQAQAVCDRLIKAGIRAIWNFAPTHLHVPDGIAIKNEDLAASLVVLSKKLMEIIRD